jgi:ubiquinone/menaquinone biosynthesis C-methylase UbiE
MDYEQRRDIIEANVREHDIEAEYYDLLHKEIFNEYEQDRIRLSLEKIIGGNIKRPTILDVGSGTGNLVSNLLTILDGSVRPEIVAVDLSGQMQDVMKRKINYPVRYYLKDIDSFLEINRKSFDVVLISSVLHHLPDYEKTLGNIIKCLNVGGTIYITHEPLNPKYMERRSMNSILDVLDYSIYTVYYVGLLLRKKIKRVKINYRVCDYHVGSRGIDPIGIKKALDRKYPVHIEFSLYPTSYFLAGLKDRLDINNSFEMIIKKITPT